MRKLHRIVISEKIVKFAHRSQITSWLLPPDIQWVVNPDCTADIPDTVAGAKMKLTFQEAKLQTLLS
jgi:hypothetical protein